MRQELSANDRRIIAGNLLSRKFDVPCAELAKEFNALGIAMYEDIFNTADRRIFIMADQGWFPTIDNIQFGIEGGEEDFGSIPLIKPLRVPYSKRHDALKVYPRAHLLVGRYIDFDRRRDDLRTEKDMLRKRTEAILRTFRSMGALVKAWPEVAPYLPARATSPNLPAVPFVELNRALGLP